MTGAARRRAAVAGTFYPADPATLGAAVDGYVAGGVAGGPSAGQVPRALIAPHAGYVYSGPVAGSAYRTVEPARGAIARVIMAGPAHRAPVRAVATTSATLWETPLGPVAVDGAARDAALDVPGVVVDDAAHAGEHSLEVQLPFLQRVLGTVSVLPLAIGPAGPAVLDVLLATWWDDPETLVVVSTDLSHYHDAATAARLDAATAAAIVAGDEHGVGAYDVCGCWAVQGLLRSVRRHGLTVDLLDLRTSADTAGRPDRVVGYGAFSVRAAA